MTAASNTETAELRGVTPAADQFEIGNSSHTAIKASVLVPQDIVEPLPDQLLYYLHQELDRQGFRLRSLPDRRLLHLEELLIARLFSIHEKCEALNILRQHCQATAIASRVVAEEVGLAPDMTYLCGWLHDIGIASCLRQLIHFFPTASPLDLAPLWPTVLRSNGAHAIHMCMRWRLPSGLRYAVRDHLNIETLRRPAMVAAATVIAESIVGELGFAFISSNGTPSRSLPIACARLGINERRLVGLACQIDARLGRDVRSQRPTGISLPSR